MESLIFHNYEMFPYTMGQQALDILRAYSTCS